MAKAGRPKKDNAVRPGELKPGLVNFNVAIDERLKQVVVDLAKQQKKTVKDYLAATLLGVKEISALFSQRFPSVPRQAKVSKITQRNETLLKAYLKTANKK